MLLFPQCSFILEGWCMILWWICYPK